MAQNGVGCHKYISWNLRYTCALYRNLDITAAAMSQIKQKVCSTDVWDQSWNIKVIYGGTIARLRVAASANKESSNRSMWNNKLDLPTVCGLIFLISCRRKIHFTTEVIIWFYLRSLKLIMTWKSFVHKPSLCFFVH